MSVTFADSGLSSPGAKQSRYANRAKHKRLMNKYKANAAGRADKIGEAGLGRAIKKARFGDTDSIAKQKERYEFDRMKTGNSFADSQNQEKMNFLASKAKNYNQGLGVKYTSSHSNTSGPTNYTSGGPASSGASNTNAPAQ